MALQVCKLESLLPKDVLCQGEESFKFHHEFSLLSHLPKWRGLHLNFSQGCFVPSLVQIDPVVLEKEDVNVKKFTDRQTDGKTDGRKDRHQEIRNPHISFQLW